MNNRDVAAAFDEIADLLEFQNANPFRVRAYRNAARRIGDLSEPLASIVADPDRELTDLDGIGKDLAEKIATLVETGKLPMLEELRAAIPAGVLALLRIPGLGPKKAAALHKELGITSLDMLRERLRGRPGAGAQRLRQEDAGQDPGRHRPGRPRRRADVLGRSRRDRAGTARPHAAAERHPADGSGRQLPPRPGNDRRPRPAWSTPKMPTP